MSAVGKAYHNVNAKYNGYFNANELLEASIDKLHNAYSENYNQILPIYPEIEVDKPEIVAEDLNKAIEKVSVVATRHEASRWVDDCYLLIGKSQFLKQDFETAEETFQYFIEEFDPSNTRRRVKKKKKSTKRSSTSKRKSNAKKKKSTRKKKRSTKKRSKKKKGSKKRGTKKRTPKKETSDKTTKKIEPVKKVQKVDNKKNENTVAIDNGSSSMLKHYSAYPEGLLWLAKTSVKRDKYSMADYYLKKITEQAEVERSVLAEIPIVKAFSMLDKKRYEEAYSFLSEGIPNIKDKKRKARLTFIQAQLLQKLDRKEEAAKAFEDVIDLKPDFVLEFNAELNLLKNSGNSSDVVRKLNKMLNEDKYDSYQDQIYFTLGELKYNKGELAESIPLYQKSIQHNTGNKTQLVESYYKLAKLFYDQENYLMSSNYFDSTSTEISKLDPRFIEVKNYSDNLKDIAKNIEIVTLQDSLLAIALMSLEEREQIAKRLKKEQLDKEAKEAEASTPTGPKIKKGIGTIVNTSTAQSNFFAYNDSKKQQGKADFIKLWGIRNLENNWRRSASSLGINSVDTDIPIENISLTETEINEILKDVPLSPQAKASSKKKIQTALFELGVLYREKIFNYKKGIESHEDLVTRFPSISKEPDAFYYLYLSNLDIKNQTRASYYLNQLKTKYPKNKYTLALTDPTYVDQKLNETKKDALFYDETFASFEAKEYENVLSRINVAMSNKDNPHAAKYGLLKAMCLGKMKGKEQYIEGLKEVVGLYPNTPEQTKAKEILRFLQGDAEAFDTVVEASKDAFNKDDDKLHYTIIIVYSNDNNLLNAVRISTNNYNRKYHKVDKIRTSTLTLNTKQGVQLILMRKWENKAKAMKYYEEVMRNKSEFIETKVENDIFVITQQNYRELTKQRSAKEYKAWFEENYLPKN